MITSNYLSLKPIIILVHSKIEIQVNSPTDISAQMKAYAIIFTLTLHDLCSYIYNIYEDYYYFLSEKRSDLEHNLCQKDTLV